MGWLWLWVRSGYGIELGYNIGENKPFPSIGNLLQIQNLNENISWFALFSEDLSNLLNLTRFLFSF